MNKLFFNAFCFLASCLNAQDTLTLRKALEIALANNYGIRIAKIDEAIAQTSDSWSGAGAYPQVLLNVAPSVVSNNVNQKFINNTEINRNNAVQRSINGSVQLNYNVLNGFKVFVTKDRLNSIAKLSGQELQQKIEECYRNVALVYYRILSLRNTERTILSQEKVALERSKLEETRYNLGKNGKAGWLEAAMDVQDIGMLKLNQSAAIVESFIEISKLLNQETGAETILIEPAGLGDLNALFNEQHQPDHAIQNSIYELRSRIKNLERKEIDRQRYPNISVLADYHYNRLINQAGFNLFNQSYGPSAGLTMNIPLYDGGRTSQQQKVNSLESDQIDLEKEQWSQEVKLAIQSEKSKMSFQQNIINLQNDKRPLAEEHLVLIRRKSELGEANALEFTQSIFRLIEIDAAKNDARLNFIESYINILYLCSEMDQLIK